MSRFSSPRVIMKSDKKISSWVREALGGFESNASPRLANCLVAVYFLAISIWVFYPFFFLGKIMIGNTDTLEATYPLLLYNIRNAHEGSPSFWNPHLFCGTPSYSFCLMQLFSPDNWPLLFVPEKYIFRVLTFVQFLKFFVFGLLSFGFFKQEINSRKWALFAATMFCLCQYTIYTVTATFTFMISILFMASAYVIWSFHGRPAYRNYLYLSLILGFLLLSNHLSWAGFAFLVIMVLSGYRVWTQDQSSRKGMVLVLALSVLTAVLLSAVRILPSWLELKEGIRLLPENVRYTALMPEMNEVFYLLLRLFNPELFGVNYVSSVPIISKLFPGEQHAGWHVNNLMPQSFGVIGAILVVLSFFYSERRSHRFWCVYVLFALALISHLNPFSVLTTVVLFPLGHSLSMQIALPIGFCALAALTGKNLEKSFSKGAIRSVWGSYRENVSIRRVLVVLYVVFLAVLSVKIILKFDTAVKLKFLVIPVLAFPALFGYYWAKNRPGASRLVFVMSVLGVFVNGVAVFVIDTGYHLYDLYLRNMFASFILLLLFLAYLQTRINDAVARYWHRLRPLVVLSVLLCLAVILFSNADELRENRRTIDYALIYLGSLRFVIVVLIFMSLIAMKGMGVNGKCVFAVLFLTLVFDQVPAWKIHINQNINPFYKGATPYPAIDALKVEGGSQVDLRSYRVNHPITILQIPALKELWGNREILADSFVAYGVRSYSGLYNDVSKRYSSFAGRFGITVNPFGFPALYENDRFLDLVGVRLTYDSGRKVLRERPNAISRFMFYTDYSVYRDENEILARLTHPDFSPQDEVVLLCESTSAGRDHTRGDKGMPITEFKGNSDAAVLTVRTDRPGVLLFNDNYHRGWTARVNGQKGQLLRANYTFMGVQLPAGTNLVEFRFVPPGFALGAVLTLLGIAFTLIFAVVLGGHRR